MVGYPRTQYRSSHSGIRPSISSFDVPSRRGRPCYSSRRPQTLSADALRIDEGSLYPALHRMAEAGWITAESVITENKRRARVYQITRAGRRQQAAETERWNTLANGVSRVLRHA